MIDVTGGETTSRGARFARVLAVGFTASSVIFACSGGATTGGSSAGGSSAVSTTSGTPSGGDHTTATNDHAANPDGVVAGAPCTTPPSSDGDASVQHSTRPSTDPNAPSGTMCSCGVAADAGPAVWSCFTLVTGPLAPPELA